MNNTLKEVLYWSGTMPDNPLETIGAMSLDDQLKATAASGFNNILLWSLHVNQANSKNNVVLGDLTWNDTLLVSSRSGSAVFDPDNQFTKLAGRLNALVAAGKKIFFSIGAGGAGDFTTIQILYSTAAGQTKLQNNFGCLLQNLSMVTGFDFDVEDCFDVPSTAWLTQVLATKFTATITYCPYEDQEWWEQCLESVYQQMKTQPVVWFNLQCYSGGSDNHPVAWADYIKQNQTKNGVSDSTTFIVPGYAASNTKGDGPGICPDAFTSKLTKHKGKIGGAFVWNSQHVFDNPAPCNGGAIPSIEDYATAISNALE